MTWHLGTQHFLFSRRMSCTSPSVSTYIELAAKVFKEETIKTRFENLRGETQVEADTLCLFVCRRSYQLLHLHFAIMVQQTFLLQEMKLRSSADESFPLILSSHQVFRLLCSDNMKKRKQIECGLRKNYIAESFRMGKINFNENCMGRPPALPNRLRCFFFLVKYTREAKQMQSSP